MDIVDIIKNTKTIYMSESSLETMMDIERVMDSLDLYAFKNWKRGELIEGPIKTTHWVECSFMWPYKMMPDPERLIIAGSSSSGLIGPNFLQPIVSNSSTGAGPQRSSNSIPNASFELANYAS